MSAAIAAIRNGKQDMAFPQLSERQCIGCGRSAALHHALIGGPRGRAIEYSET
jgi:hypothetical protein